MDATSMAGSVPSIGKLEIKSPSTDPMAALLAGNRGGGGLFGGSGGDSGGLLAILLLSMFNRGGGLWGGGGEGGGAVAAQAVATSKDVMQQLNTFQSWAANNATELAQSINSVDKSLCASSANIINAVNGVNQQMFQAFVGQSQAQTAQINNLQTSLGALTTTGFTNLSDKLLATTMNINDKLSAVNDNLDNDINDLDSAIAAGFAAGGLAECQTQNLINQTAGATNLAITQQSYALAQQLAACCCENRLAIANQNALIEKNTGALENQAAANFAALSNQLNMQTCDIKGAIAADGAATRALINQQNTDRLAAELADAKNALRDQQIIAACAAKCHGA